MTEKLSEFISQMETPDTSYRPTFFWSWNDRLEKDELERQIEVMRQGGIGGFFMHARPGLSTQYMSEEWFSATSASIEKAEKLGIIPWLYDEHGWPSGAGGGKVCALGPGYQQKNLCFKEIKGCELDLNGDCLIAAYIIQGNSVHRIKSKDAVLPEQKVLTAYYHVISDYIDVLSQKTVKEFIDTSYEVYYKKYKDKIGTVIPGIFTDEPQYGCNPFPWSFELPDYYRALYSEEILDGLPLLFLELDGYESFRYNFWLAVNRMFNEHYFKQIHDWCSERNIIFTGHHMGEDCLYEQMKFNAGVMASYEYMQMPGTDWVSRTIRETITPKQAASVAQQLGKDRVLTEQFASCNWDVPLEELKWIADWNYVNGVNFLCQHLAAYSLRGLRKRDCPASLFDHQVWWPKYNEFSEYASRVSQILSGSGQIADLLVLHPLKSAYIAFNGENSNLLHSLDNNFLAVLDMLSGLHIDYHLGDEELLSRYASTAGGKLQVGKCRYKAVILPDLLTIDSFTIDLLVRFAGEGGLVISVGDMPRWVDGKENPGLITRLSASTTVFRDFPANELFNRYIREKNADGRIISAYPGFWEKTAQGILPRTGLDIQELDYIRIDEETRKFLNLLKANQIDHVSISCGGSELNTIHYYHKLYNGREVYFFVNHDKEQAFKCTITLPATKLFAGYNPRDNKVFDLPTKVNVNREVEFEFLPMQSLMLIEVEEQNDQPSVKKEYIPLGQHWMVKDAGMNALTLDYCRYRVDDGEWSGRIPAWDVLYYLIRDRKDCAVELLFEFEVDSSFDLNEPVAMGVEAVTLLDSVLVNGSEVKNRFEGYFTERAIRVCKLNGLIKEGRNTVVIKRRFAFHESEYYALYEENVHSVIKNKMHLETETEAIFILGSFGVYSRSGFEDSDRGGCWTEGPFYIGRPKTELDHLDLIKQGFLFYNGAVELVSRQVIEVKPNTRYFFKTPRPNATAVEFSVNGKVVGTKAWEPFEVDITEYLENGRNELGIKLFSSNRNIFGPFHHYMGQIHWASWRKFIDPVNWLFCDREQSFWVDQYSFYRFGIMDEVIK